MIYGAPYVEPAPAPSSSVFVVQPTQRKCEKCPSRSRDLFWRITKRKGQLGAVIERLCPKCCGQRWDQGSGDASPTVTPKRRGTTKQGTDQAQPAHTNSCPPPGTTSRDTQEQTSLPQWSKNKRRWRFISGKEQPPGTPVKVAGREA